MGPKCCTLGQSLPAPGPESLTGTQSYPHLSTNGRGRSRTSGAASGVWSAPQWHLRPCRQWPPSAAALPPGRGWLGGCGTLPSAEVRDEPDSVYMMEAMAGSQTQWSGHGQSTGRLPEAPTQREGLLSRCYSWKLNVPPKSTLKGLASMGCYWALGVKCGRTGAKEME